MVKELKVSEQRVKLLLKNVNLPFVDPYIDYPDLVVTRLSAFNKTLEIMNSISGVLRALFKEKPELNEEMVSVTMLSTTFYEEGEVWCEYEIDIELDNAEIRRTLVKEFKKQKLCVLTRKESRLLEETAITIEDEDLEGEFRTS